MNDSYALLDAPRHFELCFRSLFQPGRAYVFPCDAAGRVDMDSLSERARNNYLYARAVRGREFTLPDVQPVRCTEHAAHA
ncbi:hypothetical protein HLB44_10700 [Aquincola sp. S2]|uniref:DUF1488 domain-containing protein n=1 Tax=Pseudaquabacterium terrae TaxID=2732868 RepID=A0ABX2EFP8_9BURK|nr:hypothetical protein [Aquabacterium terrae]NRF67454.1 hypothetical protein [Aquabacterium terrae]